MHRLGSCFISSQQPHRSRTKAWYRSNHWNLQEIWHTINPIMDKWQEWCISRNKSASYFCIKVVCKRNFDSARLRDVYSLPICCRLCEQKLRCNENKIKLSPSHFLEMSHFTDFSFIRGTDKKMLLFNEIFKINPSLMRTNCHITEI